MTELLTGEEKPCGPSGYVDDTIAIDDGIAVGSEGSAEGDVVIEGAALIEIDDAETVGAGSGALETR